MPLSKRPVPTVSGPNGAQEHQFSHAVLSSKYVGEIVRGHRAAGTILQHSLRELRPTTPADTVCANDIGTSNGMHPKCCRGFSVPSKQRTPFCRSAYKECT